MPKNDTTRLIVYAVCFLTIVISAVLLRLFGDAELRDTLQWVTIVSGLLGSGLAGLKLNQDRRDPGPSEPEQ